MDFGAFEGYIRDRESIYRSCFFGSFANMRSVRGAPELDEILRYILPIDITDHSGGQTGLDQENDTSTEQQATDEVPHTSMQKVVQDVQANIKKAQERQKLNYDKRRSTPNVSSVSIVQTG